ncbi:MAG: DUF1232 domain-containing protein [Firmicutes bacterium]|nr:DUF1232 domain-containing protein [Bacillota bacterium]
MEFSKERIEAQLEKRAKKALRLVSDNKRAAAAVKKIINKAKKIKGMRRYAYNIESMCYLVRDYANCKYTEISNKKVVMMASAMLYILTPIDLIPDIIPVIGRLDDIAVIAYVLQSLRVELVKYNVWRSEH